MTISSDVQQKLAMKKSNDVSTRSLIDKSQKTNRISQSAHALIRQIRPRHARLHPNPHFSHQANHPCVLLIRLSELKRKSLADYRGANFAPCTSDPQARVNTRSLVGGGESGNTRVRSRGCHGERLLRSMYQRRLISPLI